MLAPPPSSVGLERICCGRKSRWSCHALSVCARPFRHRAGKLRRLLQASYLDLCKIPGAEGFKRGLQCALVLCGLLLLARLLSPRGACATASVRTPERAFLAFRHSRSLSAWSPVCSMVTGRVPVNRPTLLPPNAPGVPNPDPNSPAVVFWRSRRQRDFEQKQPQLQSPCTYVYRTSR